MNILYLHGYGSSGQSSQVVKRDGQTSTTQLYPFGPVWQKCMEINKRYDTVKEKYEA